jgi:uncharacterized membrane protein
MRLCTVLVTKKKTTGVSKRIVQWLAFHVKKMVSSIAFFPALIALLFLALSYIMIHVDYSALGKQIKSQAEWLKLKDASTARTIVSVIAGGILSLTVFSFTMVMVILNQAASQMSNRVLDNLIGNRYQQFILGFYIGTIVYSLFLLSAIRDINSGIYVPSLSTYLLIAFAIIDIFLFIYFLHYITQSVKYAVIIRRIHRQTEKALKESCHLAEQRQSVRTFDDGGEPLLSPAAGIFEGFNKDALVNLAKKENFILNFLYPVGSFVLCHAPIATIHAIKKGRIEALLPAILPNLHINGDEAITNNFYYGFRQLTEVAVKALSPGINDPGTAVESLRALANLFSFRIRHFPDPALSDDDGIIRVMTRELEFEELFDFCFLPIWAHGKNDRFVQREMRHLLLQLQTVQSHPAISRQLLKINRQMTFNDND